MNKIELLNNFYLESAKQVVAGDSEHFELLKEKEPSLADTNVLCK